MEASTEKKNPQQSQDVLSETEEKQEQKQEQKAESEKIFVEIPQLPNPPPQPSIGAGKAKHLENFYNNRNPATTQYPTKVSDFYTQIKTLVEKIGKELENAKPFLSASKRNLELRKADINALKLALDGPAKTHFMDQELIGVCQAINKQPLSNFIVGWNELPLKLKKLLPEMGMGNIQANLTGNKEYQTLQTQHRQNQLDLQKAQNMLQQAHEKEKRTKLSFEERMNEMIRQHDEKLNEMLRIQREQQAQYEREKAEKDIKDEQEKIEKQQQYEREKAEKDKKDEQEKKEKEEKHKQKKIEKQQRYEQERKAFLDEMKAIRETAEKKIGTVEKENKALIQSHLELGKKLTTTWQKAQSYDKYYSSANFNKSQLFQSNPSKNDNTVEVNEIPDSLCCPITHDLFKDPVFANDGHTYDREAIEDWVKKVSDKSPLTGETISMNFLPNFNMRKCIREFLESQQPQPVQPKPVDASKEIEIPEQAPTAPQLHSI